MRALPDRRHTDRLTIYPTVEPEWTRCKDILVDLLPVGADLDPRSFFRADPPSLIDFLRFRRAFSGDVLSPRAWRERLEKETAAILGR